MSITLLKCIVFDSKGTVPVLGTREIVLTYTDRYGHSISNHSVDVMHEDLPTEFSLPDTRLCYHVTSATCVAADHVPYLPPGNTMLPLFYSCKIHDPDTEKFSGGFVSVTLQSGASANDTLCVVPNFGIEKKGNEIYFKGAFVGKMSTFSPQSSLLKKARVLKLFKSGQPEVPPQRGKSTKKAPKEDTREYSASGNIIYNNATLKRCKYILYVLLFIRVLSKGLLSRVYRGLKLEFASAVEVPAAQAFIRCICFTTVGTTQREGVRHIETKLQLGQSIVRTIVRNKITEKVSDQLSPTFSREISVKVAPPLLSVVGTKSANTSQTPTMKYQEGNGYVRISSFDMDEGIGTWENGMLKITVCNSFEEDALTIVEKDGIKLVNVKNAQRVSCVEEKPPDTQTPHSPMSPGAGSPGALQQSSDLPAPSLTIRNNELENTLDAKPSPSPTPAPDTPEAEGDTQDDSKPKNSSARKHLQRTFNKIKGKLQEKVSDRINAQNMLADLLEEGRQGIKEDMLQRGKKNVLIEGKFIGTLEPSERNTIKVKLNKSDIKRRDILLLLRNIGYKNKSSCPQTDSRIICFTVYNGGGYSGSMLIQVDVVEVDNVTSVVLQNAQLKYRAVADESSDPFLIAPLHTGFIHDPDTDWFDLGHITLELFSGGHKGDSFRLLTMQQQEMQIKQKKKQFSVNSHLAIADPSKCLFEVRDKSLVLVATGKTFGVVSYPKPKGFGGKCIHIQFKKTKGEDIVSRELFTFVLNSIAYQNVGYAEKTGKEINTAFTIKVADGQNPTEGRKRFTIVLSSPLVQLPGFHVMFTVKVQETMMLWPSLLLNTTTLEKGSVIIRTLPDSCESVISFDTAALHGVVLRDCGLYQGNSLLAVVPTLTPTNIVIDIGLSCKISPFQLQTMLRALVFKSSQPGSAKVELVVSLGKRGDKQRASLCTAKFVVRSGAAT